MAERTWTCQRTVGGVRCGSVNPRRLMKCPACGRRRPAVKKPEHSRVLREMTYEQFVAEFGEVCGVCGAGPKDGKRLCRDHDHVSGEARGLLCFRCNYWLPRWMTIERLELILVYLRRAAARPARYTQGDVRDDG